VRNWSVQRGKEFWVPYHPSSQGIKILIPRDTKHGQVVTYEKLGLPNHHGGYGKLYIRVFYDNSILGMTPSTFLSRVLLLGIFFMLVGLIF
jgi:hypothetical protein